MAAAASRGDHGSPAVIPRTAGPLPGVGEAPSLSRGAILLLQAAFHEDPDVALRSWDTLVRDAGSVGEVVAWAQRGAEQRLLPALGRRSELLELPQEAVRACRDATVEAWGLNERLLLLVRPAVERLVAAGIPVVALKGTALIGDVYPKHQLRPLGDVDLLVPRARVRDALRTLAQEGWVDPQPDRWLRSVGAHGVNLGGPIPGASVDLHWRPVSATPHRIRRQPWPAHDLEALPFAHPLADTGLLRPRAARLLALITVHGLQVDNLSPHWIGDIAELLRTNPAMDGSEVAAVAAEDVFNLQVREGLRLVHDLLGVPLPFSLRALDPPRRRAARDERARWESRRRLHAIVHDAGIRAAARRLLLYGRAVTSRGAWLSRFQVLLAVASTWVSVRRARTH